MITSEKKELPHLLLLTTGKLFLVMDTTLFVLTLSFDHCSQAWPAFAVWWRLQNEVIQD